MRFPAIASAQCPYLINIFQQVQNVFYMGGLSSAADRKIADRYDRYLKTGRADHLIVKKIVPAVSDSLIDTRKRPKQYLRES